jgi:2-dehydro-3-deoxyphosphogluconate aldolase/(4S)-4-hydroxy-2-oxoglutarate aldolase
MSRAASEAARALETILRARVVPIIRTRSAEWAMAVAEVLASSGLGVIEVTFTVPDAAAVIERLRRRFPEILVGGGTVTDAPTARRAVAAGAQFLLSPALSPGMAAVARRHGVLAVPGAYTPTEALAALEGGAELVKIFPADTGGPAHIRAILAPLPSARLLPTGGVRPDSAGEWLAAGAAAVGIGSALVGPGDGPVDAPALRARIEILKRSLAAPGRLPATDGHGRRHR